MASNLQKVRPGDLIRSELINSMIDAIVSLEECCEKLGAPVSGETGTTSSSVVVEPPPPATRVEIKSFKPTELRVTTDELIIIGSGFSDLSDSKPVVTLEAKVGTSKLTSDLEVKEFNQNSITVSLDESRLRQIRDSGSIGPHAAPSKTIHTTVKVQMRGASATKEIPLRLKG